MMGLVLHVPLYHQLIQADGGNEVTDTPESARGKFVGLFLDPSGGFALEYRYGIGD